MAKRFGVMLDMSRNAVMKPEEVKDFASIIKSFGYNMLQLYTEDTYEVDGEPYFGYLRGRYTKEELKDIVSYCNSIGLEVIPCMQTLAHLNQIFLWREYKRVNDTGAILLVGEERTYTLIENMFRSLRECFTTDIIHIGMDEAHMLGLGKYLDKHGYQNRFDILKGHLLKVIDIAKKYGFKPIMWSDMFFRLANGGEYYDWSNITDEVRAAKPEGVDLVFWDYYHNDKETYDGMLDAHKTFSGETWFAGGVWTWMGFTPFNAFSVEAMSKAVVSCQERDIDNIFMTMWGDDGRECSFYSVLPALYLIKRAHDGVTDKEALRAEFYELTGESLDAMMALDLANMMVGNTSSTSNIAKTMLYSDPLFGFIDVTVKGGAAPECRKNAETLREYAKASKNYAYLFEVQAALADILEYKYDLGKRARDAYKAGDKAALTALLPEYTICATRVKKFHRLFSAQWHKENKPHGFEVHDYRLGGLMRRLESCMERVEAYLAGRIDSLPELEEELLPLDYVFDGQATINGTPGTAGIPSVNRWIQMASVNNLK